MGIPSRFDDPDAHYVIEDSILKLRIDRDMPRRAKPSAAAVSSIQTSDFRIGATPDHVQRLDKFAQKYGWWEIRSRMPKGDGLHAAFWLVQADPRHQEYTLDNRRLGDVVGQGNRGPDSVVEIDIFEALGRYDRQLNMTVLFPRNFPSTGRRTSMSMRWNGRRGVSRGISTAGSSGHTKAPRRSGKCSFSWASTSWAGIRSSRSG